MATRAKHAKLVSCVQVKTPLPIMTEVGTGETIELNWVATDSVGRRFFGDTQAEAEQMCHEYNHPKEGA